MFADYRVPQILHHLCILDYSDDLTSLLTKHIWLQSGSLEEMSIRAAAILAVEAVRDTLSNDADNAEQRTPVKVNSVLIDFYLWDLAKKLEGGEDSTDDVRTVPMLPAHRTRSIWY